MMNRLCLWFWSALALLSLRCRRRVVPAVIALVALGCGGISLPNLGGDGGPAGLFREGEKAYLGALEGALSYSEACMAVPTVECARLTLRIRDVNRRAQEPLAIGGLLVRGFATPEIACDEAAEPGCTERLRQEQLQAFATALQSLATELGTRRD